MNFKTFFQRYKTILMIVGIVAISASVIYFRLYIHSDGQVSNQNINQAEDKAYLSIDELVVSATTTDAIKQKLEEAFQQDRLVKVFSYSIDGEKDMLVLSAPSVTGKTNETKPCDARDFSFCGLYRVNGDGARLVLYGSGLDGFQKIERMIDSTHTQFLTSWDFLNFESTDRSSLDLETSELSSLLTTETDQDFLSASMTVTTPEDALTLFIEGDAIKTRLFPKRVVLKDQDGQVVMTLSDQEVLLFQKHLEADMDRKLKFIQVVPSDQDVEERSIQVILYGTPYVLNLEKRTLNILR